MVDHRQLTGKGQNGPPGGLSKRYTEKGIQIETGSWTEGRALTFCLTRDSLRTFSAIDLRIYHWGMLTMDGPNGRKLVRVESKVSRVRQPNLK